jgi:hypothetical protein
MYNHWTVELLSRIVGRRGATTTRTASFWRPILSALCLSAAVSAGAALAVRPLSSLDLGYHLAYGEETLDTLRPVDTNPYIYTNPPPGDPNRPPPGPGCWYDDAGRYRFANANWLTQVAMACAWRLGRFDALCAIQAALAAGVFVLVAASARRLGAGWGTAALGAILVAVAMYPRLNLRPELFGYAVLAGQLAILAGRAEPAFAPAPGARLRASENAAIPGQPPSPAGFGWRHVAGLITLQILFVNLHSYFLLGLLLTGAFLGEGALKLLWARRAARRAAGGQSDAPPILRERTRMLAIAMGGQLAACFINPWTWRIVLLPFETILFLRAGNVGSVDFSRSRHPWAIIAEFANVTGPWSPAEVKADIALYAILGLAALAAAACAVRRRWGRLAIMACMSAVAMSMRRNAACGAIALAPLAIGTLAQWPGAILARARPRLAAAARAWTGPIAAAIALAMIAWVASQRFYTSEDLPWRFGWGASRVMLPLDAADFLTRRHPAGRLWTDYNTSSNFYYFTRPHPPVPVLTNTWAYPPAVMREFLGYLDGDRPFEEARRRYSLEAAALSVAGSPAAIRAIRDDANWTLVYLDPMHLIFLRTAGPDADLARRLAIQPESFDANALMRQARQWDPAPGYTMRLAGLTLYRLGWDGHAIALYKAALAEEPRDHRSWTSLGICHARRGQRRLLEMMRLQENRRYSQADEALQAGKSDWEEARRCFIESNRLQPDAPGAADDLKNISRQLEALSRGAVMQMQYPE